MPSSIAGRTSRWSAKNAHGRIQILCSRHGTGANDFMRAPGELLQQEKPQLLGTSSYSVTALVKLTKRRKSSRGRLAQV